MACEGWAKGDQTRQQICSCQLVSKWASRESWWLGGKEKRTRADEWLATKLENKQLGIANNCMPSGKWRGRDFLPNHPELSNICIFHSARVSAPTLPVPLRQPSLCASRRLVHSTCRPQLFTGNTSLVSRKAQGAGMCAHTWKRVLKSHNRSWAPLTPANLPSAGSALCTSFKSFDGQGSCNVAKKLRLLKLLWWPKKVSKSLKQGRRD